MKKSLIIKLLLVVFIITTLTSCIRMVKPNDGGNYVAVEDFFFTTTLIGDMRIIKEEKDYDIIYYRNQICPDGKRDCESFYISLLDGENLQIVRDKAEQSFLNILNISKKEACRLYVSLSVTYDVNPSAMGQYNLSFCPDGKPLPNNR